MTQVQEIGTPALSSRWFAMLVAGVLALLSAAPLVDAAPGSADGELEISGKVVYRASSPSHATRGAEVDLNEIFANNPAYARIDALGLDKTEGHGKELFAEAERAAKKALATVANEADVHVITTLGGVSGGEVEIEDLTERVIDQLPIYCIDGTVYHGSKRAIDKVAEMDREQVLDAIPSYRKWLELDERDADYYFLKEEYEKAYLKALRKVVRDNDITAVIEVGGVTSRLDPPEDISEQVIAALDV